MWDFPGSSELKNQSSTDEFMGQNSDKKNPSHVIFNLLSWSPRRSEDTFKPSYRNSSKFSFSKHDSHLPYSFSLFVSCLSETDKLSLGVYFIVAMCFEMSCTNLHLEMGLGKISAFFVLFCFL